LRDTDKTTLEANVTNKKADINTLKTQIADKETEFEIA
jgi:hypothetical protein